MSLALIPACSPSDMPYVPTSTTAYTTVTVTHTTTHTVTATALQSSTSSNSSAAAFGDINNTASVIALASFGFSAAVGVVRYARGITSSTKIDHWRKLVKQWREWEQTLSTEQRDILMQENPTLIKQLDDELSRYARLWLDISHVQNPSRRIDSTKLWKHSSGITGRVPLSNAGAITLTSAKSTEMRHKLWIR